MQKNKFRQQTKIKTSRFSFCSFISPKLFCYVSVQLFFQHFVWPEHKSIHACSQLTITIIIIIILEPAGLKQPNRQSGVSFILEGWRRFLPAEVEAETFKTAAGNRWTQRKQRTAFWEICLFAIKSRTRNFFKTISFKRQRVLERTTEQTVTET